MSKERHQSAAEKVSQMEKQLAETRRKYEAKSPAQRLADFRKRFTTDTPEKIKADCAILEAMLKKENPELAKSILAAQKQAKKTRPSAAQLRQAAQTESRTLGECLLRIIHKSFMLSGSHPDPVRRQIFGGLDYLAQDLHSLLSESDCTKKVHGFTHAAGLAELEGWYDFTREVHEIASNGVAVAFACFIEAAAYASHKDLKRMPTTKATKRENLEIVRHW